MGLRARLATFFVVITVIPVTVAVVVLQVQIDRRLDQRAASELAGAQAAALSTLDHAREQLSVAADVFVADGAAAAVAGVDDAEAWLADQQDRVTLDVLILTDPEGGVLADLARAPRFSGEGAAVPSSAEMAASARARTDPPPGVLLEVREMHGAGPGESERLLGWLIAGRWLDEELTAQRAGAQDMAIVVDDIVLAATATPDAAPPAFVTPGAVEALEIDGQRVLATAVPAGAGLADGTRLVTWVAAGDRGDAIPLGLLVLPPATLLAGLLGWLLATAVVAPVRRAADTARAVAGGDLTRVLAPTGGRELEDLARALNVMSAELAARLDEVERSRDQLRGSLSRLGRTLSSSLDLDRMLAVVVETAMDTLYADRAGLYLFTPERDALYVKVGRGLGQRPARLAHGEGLIGFVARVQRPTRLPADTDVVPAPTPAEPAGAQQLVVPLAGRGRMLGVLTLIRDDLVSPYSPEDLETLRSFGAQASVAIENVLLHQEAQRLSVTDNLTGLWNFRYFQIQADRELESAERFARPLAMAIVDIDHFKEVNDDFGHQAGDEALVEVARRIHEATRAPDVVARYGGEEFVVLLPGTDHDGALATAERIRVAVGGSPVGLSATVGREAGQTALPITCSVGVAAFPEHGRSVATLLRAADAAMYRAKTLGRNRVAGSDVRGLRGGSRPVGTRRDPDEAPPGHTG